MSRQNRKRYCLLGLLFLIMSFIGIVQMNQILSLEYHMMGVEFWIVSLRFDMWLIVALIGQVLYWVTQILYYTEAKK